jgi:hypothetical protein
MRGTSRRRAGRPTFSRLVAAYQQAHPVGNIRRLNPYHQAHLLRFFGARPLTAITTESAADYAMRRQAAGVAAELVNEELRALGYLVRFAAQRGELPQEPTIWVVPTARPPRDDAGRPSRNWFVEHPTAIAGASRSASRPIKSKDRWSQFWRTYPADMQTTPEGEPMTDTWRLDRLRREFGLTRSRTALVRQRARALETLKTP